MLILFHFILLRDNINPYNVNLIRLTGIHHFLQAPGLRLISKRSIKLSSSGRRNFNSSFVLHGSNAIKRMSLKRSPIFVGPARTTSVIEISHASFCTNERHVILRKRKLAHKELGTNERNQIVYCFVTFLNTYD